MLVMDIPSITLGAMASSVFKHGLVISTLNERVSIVPLSEIAVSKTVYESMSSIEVEAILKLHESG